MPDGAEMNNAAQWVGRVTGKPCSRFGAQVAELLDSLYLGLHHLPRTWKKHTDFTDPRHIEVVDSGGLATFDFDRLTRLVFLAHDHCIRVEVAARSPRAHRTTVFRAARKGWAQFRAPPHPGAGRRGAPQLLGAEGGGDLSGLPGPFEPSPTPFCACPVQHDAYDCAEERCPGTPVELLDPCTAYLAEDRARLAAYLGTDAGPALKVAT